MESLIRVQSEPGADTLWDLFEDKPETIAEGAESWGLLGIILGIASNVAGGLILFMPQFAVGSVGILWYNWVLIALQAPLLILQVWGLAQYIDAAAETSAVSTFRAWRTNLLTSGLNNLIQVSASIMILVWTLLMDWSPVKLTYVGYFWFNCAGVLVAGVAWWFVFWLKDWWYENDPEGAQRDEYFNLFGLDQPDDKPNRSNDGQIVDMHGDAHDRDEDHHHGSDETDFEF